MNADQYGLPKPPSTVRSLALRLNERFMHLRERAWLRAIGGEIRGRYLTLAEVQADMPDWPHLFAFHAFTAAWLALPNDDDQAVFLDVWEAAP